jgi:hypothetical protein
LPKGNVKLPVATVMALEAAVKTLPADLSRKIAFSRAMRSVLGIRIIATK